MSYTVLSPWAHVEREASRPLCSRLDILEGKTIGIFSHFKGHSPIIGKVIEDTLRKTYKNISFSYFQYKKDTRELIEDGEVYPDFRAWLAGCDGVVAVYGDAGSCTMYHALNTSAVEKLGKPAVLLVNENLVSSAQSGCATGRVPALRYVTSTLDMSSAIPVIDEAFIRETMAPAIVPCVPALADALTCPLTEKERHAPEDSANALSARTFTGSLSELNRLFYRYGWCNGLPINPPTREAVDEMLRGSPLPPDYVVAKLPPMNGEATVEKIAVNAVMAGCLPTYMPVLIALVRCMVSPRLHLVGWTCSTAGFAPVITLSGPVRRAIGANSTVSALSPLFKANAAISRAYALIVSNIAGVRPTREITGGSGHENLCSIFVSEDEEGSPWQPLHSSYGVEEGESAVTLFWAHGRVVCKVGTSEPGALLAAMCDCTDDQGFDPGVTFILNATWAKALAEAGMSRDDVRDYICEYARKPAAEVRTRWMRDNNHMPRSLQLPLDPSRSCRKYFDTEHIQVLVCGGHDKLRCIAMCGGGDHGGPATVKIELPENWDALVREYADYAPDFISY